MTSEQIRAGIEKASDQLLTLQTELERKDALLKSGRDVNKDGKFDDSDVEAVQRVRARRDAAQVRIDQLLCKLMLAEAKESGAPLEIVTFEDEGMLVEGSADRKLFSQDLGLFKSQIRTWRVDMRESLGRVVNTMLDPKEEGPDFPKDEIISLVTTVLTASQPHFVAALAVANTLLDLAINYYERTLPSAPSLRELETHWRKAIDAVDDKVAEDSYNQLVQLFVEANHMERDEQYVYVNFIPDWDRLIAGFCAGDVLPSSSSINQAFLKFVMDKMPDSTWDIDRVSGEVTIYMEFDMEKNEFSFSSGSINDLSEEVKGALKADPAIFGSDEVISLPLPIRFYVSGAGFMEGKFCELIRSTRTSGSTDFKFMPTPINAGATMKEQGTMFQIFMKRKIYNSVTVSQILA